LASAVVQAIDVSTGRTYAVKIVSADDLAGHSLLKQFEQELAILRELYHERIVRLLMRLQWRLVLCCDGELQQRLSCVADFGPRAACEG
jgi:hypothetical protein